MSHLASRIASSRCLIGLPCCVGSRVPANARAKFPGIKVIVRHCPLQNLTRTDPPSPPPHSTGPMRRLILSLIPACPLHGAFFSDQESLSALCRVERRILLLILLLCQFACLPAFSAWCWDSPVILAHVVGMGFVAR